MSIRYFSKRKMNVALKGRVVALPLIDGTVGEGNKFPLASQSDMEFLYHMKASYVGCEEVQERKQSTTVEDGVSVTESPTVVKKTVVKKNQEQ